MPLSLTWIFSKSFASHFWFRLAPVRRTFITCSTPNLQEEFSSCSFYPITYSFPDVPSIKTWSHHMKHDLNCLDPNSIELCIFCELYFRFCFVYIYTCIFVFLYVDSSRWHTHATTHQTGMPIACTKMTSLDAIFCRGNKSSSHSLARFCHRKHKKSNAQALHLWKNLSLTCRQVCLWLKAEISAEINQRIFSSL